MLQRLFRTGFPIFCLGACAAFAQGPPPPAELLPDGAVAVVHIARPGVILHLAHQLQLLEALLPQSPEAQALLAFLNSSGQVRTDSHSLLRKFVGAGFTYAVYPGDSFVLFLDAEDPAVLDHLRNIAQLLIGTQGDKGKFSYRELPGGARAFSMHDKYFFARIGTRLLITNREASICAFFEPAALPSLAASPAYRQAARSVGADAAGWAFVNMGMLNRYPPVRKSLDASTSPFDILLTAALKQPLRDSQWLAISLQVEARSLQLHAATDGKLAPSGVGAFTLPAAGDILPNLTLPRQIAGLSLWRDLGKFYAARENLFPEKTAAGISFANFMEIFFSGRDLKTDVFDRIHPQIRLVVARQQYDPAIGTPDAQYPAAALIFRVDQPEQFGNLFEEAWQKAIGLSNCTRGQQNLPGLILDESSHGGFPITYCYYSASNQKDRRHLPARFNIRPALVRVGPYLILSSTDALAKDVIDAVNREDQRTPAARSDAHTLFEITGPEELAALLTANRDGMIRRSVLEKGKMQKAAEADFDRNLALLQRVAGARLSIAPSSADLELRFK